MKRFETTKLFYSKYLYKVSFNSSLNNIFRTEYQKPGTLSYVRKKLDALTESYRNGIQMQVPVYRTWQDIDTDTYLNARILYATLIRSKEYRIRVESWSRITVFSNDENLIEKIGERLKDTARVEIYKPCEITKKTILENTNTIVSDNPVYWPIKISLGTKRGDYSGFANWIRSNSDKVKIGDVALESLNNGTLGYSGGYYLFVKSEKILHLITIMIGDNIRRIDQVVYKGDLDK